MNKLVHPPLQVLWASCPLGQPPERHKRPGRGCCPRGTVDRSAERRGLHLLQDTRSRSLGQVGTCCEPGLSPHRTADHPASHLVTRATLGHLPGPAEPCSSATTSGNRTRHLGRRPAEARRGGGLRGNSGLYNSKRQGRWQDMRSSSVLGRGGCPGRRQGGANRLRSQ